MVQYYPDELLEILELIKGPEDIVLQKVDLEASVYGTEITVTLDKGEMKFQIPFTDIEFIGAAQYWNESNKAKLLVKKFTFDNMPDWYDKVFQPWVKNDTGYSISPAFSQAIIKQIERIQSVLENI